jgi:hypothetical protein
MMLSPGAPPLALLPLGRTDTRVSPAAPAISPARGNSVASEEPRASTPEPHHAAALPEPDASPPPPAPVVAADPAPAPATSPASEPGADDRVAAVVPEKDAAVPEAAASAPPPAPAPSAMATASGTPDDVCKRDEERLAELQAKPSIMDVLSFADEFRCSKLQPQLLALLDSLGQAVQSEEASGPSGALPSTKSAGETAPSPSGAVGCGRGVGERLQAG